MMSFVQNLQTNWCHVSPVGHADISNSNRKTEQNSGENGGKEAEETGGETQYLNMTDGHISVYNMLILLRICVSLIPTPTRGMGRFIFHKIVSEILGAGTGTGTGVEPIVVPVVVDPPPVVGTRSGTVVGTVGLGSEESQTDEVEVDPSNPNPNTAPIPHKSTVLSLLTSYVSDTEVVDELMRCGYGSYAEQDGVGPGSGIGSEVGSGVDGTMLTKTIHDILCSIKTLVCTYTSWSRIGSNA